jgi:hypothetical protein
MEDRERARRRMEDALERLGAVFGEAREAFRRLEEAHGRGDPAPALFADFEAATERVHPASAAFHEAREEYRRVLASDGEGGERPTGAE